MILTRTLSITLFMIFALSANAQKSALLYPNGEDWEKFGFFTFQNREGSNPDIASDFRFHKGIVLTVFPSGPNDKLTNTYTSQGLLIKSTRESERDGKIISTLRRKTDLKGRPLEIITDKQMEGGDVYESDTLIVAYNNNDQIASTSYSGMESAYTYDKDGHVLTRAVVGKGFEGEKYSSTTSYGYDEKGRILFEIIPEVDGQLYEKNITYKDFQKDGFSYTDIKLYKIEKSRYQGKDNKREVNEQYREVYDNQGRLVEYDKVGEFSNYIIYDALGRLTKVFQIGKIFPNLPRVKELKYDAQGRVISESEWELSSFASPQVYKPKVLIMRKVYNHQTGTFQVSGSMIEGGTLTGKFKVIN